MSLDRLPNDPSLRRAFVDVKRGWLPGGALACSGGHDSTALLLLAVQARRVGAVGEFVALHVNHGTRPDAVDDASFLAAMCSRFETPFVRLNVAAVEPGDERQQEHTLRRLRYDALGGAVARLGLAGVMTAHTRDDQVETALMRLLSGAGPLAAAGMRARQELSTASGRLLVARPLLAVTRTELGRVLAAAGVEPRLDPTNRDRRYRRNALRADVIPRMQRAFPGFEEALLRSLELAARDAGFIDQSARDAAATALRAEGTATLVRRDWLREAAPAVATRVLRTAWERLVCDNELREISFERLERLRQAARGRTGATIELPGGVVATIEREVVALRRVARDGNG